ncbi:MAG: hypothetical protein ABI746_13550, partial [Dermatophilaceae bacterium]
PSPAARRDRPGEGGSRHPDSVQRASANDLMELATDTPSAPQHVAAVLRLDFGCSRRALYDDTAHGAYAPPPASEKPATMVGGDLSHDRRPGPGRAD